jgi:hypothetical protein
MPKGDPEAELWPGMTSGHLGVYVFLLVAIVLL